MALDMLVDSTELDNGLTTVANAIRAKGGTSERLAFPQGMAQAIEDLPSGGITPTGNINITDTNVTDVTNYATAQVVDADLVAGNIKKDVNILGVVGSFEGGGGLPNVRKFTVVTDSTLGTYGGISFPVIESGRANYLIMNTDATHLNGTDRHVRAIGLCIDYNYATTKQAIGIARYDMASGGAIVPSMTISDGVLTMLGGSVYHMEQTYTLDVYEVIW